MLVSVIIPSYNHEKYIKDAIESVLNQTYKQLELIVIDDGSSDSSPAIIKSFKDKRINFIKQENIGAHNTINRGLSLAQGDYISILNSDDLFTVDKIEQSLFYLDKYACELSCSWIEVIDQDSKTKGIKEAYRNMRPAWAKSDNKFGVWETDDFLLNILSSNFVSTTSNMFFKRNIYEEIGGMRNLRFAHDWDFMLRVVEKFKCGIVKKPLIKYRIHSSNTISTNKKWMMFEVCWVLAINLFRFEGKKLYSKDMSRDELAYMINQMHSSINLGGCDKMFWVLKQYIESRRYSHGFTVDEELLNSEELRNVFISMLS